MMTLVVVMILEVTSESRPRVYFGVAGRED